jgi:hypothetical protein
MVRPEMAAPTAALISKMRKLGVPFAVLRCTVNRLAPGPAIVRLLSINNAPPVNTMVLGAGNEKLMVSVGPAATRA